MLVYVSSVSVITTINSDDGLEITWASNVMSYFLLSNLFLDTLKASAPSRIVNVASNYAGDLDVSDVQFSVCYFFLFFLSFLSVANII
jgi:NAD(P)-dependent dehydrogenase (short-subunit alcohol dehydrogenase family)